LVVLFRHLDGFAEISDVSRIIFLTDIVLVAFCDDKIALIVGAYVKTGYDTARKTITGRGGYGIRRVSVGAQGRGTLAIQEGADSS
jgi:hypothetical protein